MSKAEEQKERKYTLANLRRKKSAVSNKKRVGRGDGSGSGGTAGRGHKGQKSRSGFSVGTGFEGGQMPLYRRMPKQRGTGLRVTNPNVYKVINLSQLNKFEDETIVDNNKLYEARLISRLAQPVKICGDGDLEKKLTINVAAISKSAEAKISKAGGKVERS